jgi:flagellar L-ring protein precursor FlgH
MTTTSRGALAGLLVAAFLAAFPVPALSQGKTTEAGAKMVVPKPVLKYDELYQRYLQTARATEAPTTSSIAWMADLGTDPRARRANDLVTVRVVENIAASGTADSSTAKGSSAGIGVPNLFGVEKKLPESIDPGNLAKLSADTKFQGGGATTRTGVLTAVMTARVSEVLPNGDLVLEGAREIEINGDRQMVVLTGVVRPVDIAPNNTVLSTQIGQLSIRYFGNGLIRDNLKPGWLVRVLNKIF